MWTQSERLLEKIMIEKNLKKKITTSGCAQGTIFGDIYDEIQKIKIHVLFGHPYLVGKTYIFTPVNPLVSLPHIFPTKCPTKMSN